MLNSYFDVYLIFFLNVCCKLEKLKICLYQSKYTIIMSAFTTFEYFNSPKDVCVYCLDNNEYMYMTLVNVHKIFEEIIENDLIKYTYRIKLENSSRPSHILTMIVTGIYELDGSFNYCMRIEGNPSDVFMFVL